MASSSALPAGLKLRLGLKYVPFLERRASVLDVNAPSLAAGAGLDEETIGDWGRREMGDDFVELMVYPLLASYYGVTPEETGAGVFHGLAREGLRVRLLGVRGGVASLGRAVARWLEARGSEIRTGVQVEALEAEESGVRVRWADGVADHDAVVVALPAPEAARLVPSAPWLGGVRYHSTATLILATDGPVGSDWFGLSFPRREALGASVAAVCAQEAKEVGGVGPGLVVLPAPAVADRWALGEPSEAMAMALPVVEEVLPGVRGRITEARLVRVRAGMFVPLPGHFASVDRLSANGLPPRVALAGDYLVAPTVEGAVRSGVRAADRLTTSAG